MAENFFGLTDTGRQRDNNEDAFIAERLPNGLIAACVIDGVGGHDGGEVAAAIARSTILQRLQDFTGDAQAVLHTALLEANAAIYTEKARDKSNMACVLTLAVADAQNNQVYYAHVGDTRLYLLRDGSLVKLTKDQSFVGFLEDSGRLSEAEAMAHPKRNEINKALGFDPNIERQADYIETGQSPFLPGDLLLLCSDGLTDLVSKKEMTAVLTASGLLPQKAKALVDAANNAGGKDNITVVLVKNDKKPQRQKATKPVLIKKQKTETFTPVTAVAATDTPPANDKTHPKKSNGALWAFAALSLLLAVVAGWLWTQNRELKAALPQPVVSSAAGDAEKKLSEAVGLVERELLLSPDSFGNTVTLTDTVFVRQDTLRINGNGLVLQADSAYRGPALVVSPNCKQLVLENLAFKDFGVAIQTSSKNLVFRNVVFQSGAVALQQNLLLSPQDTLNGTLADAFIYWKDSLPK